MHDVAGNTAKACPSSFKVDKTAPTFSCPGSGDTSWHNANVTLSCSGDDGTGGSGVAAADGTFSLATTVADGSQTDSASTPSYVVHDVAGNTATAGPFSFKVDKTAPTFSCPGSGDTSWHNANVTLSCSGDDGTGGSGVAAADGTFSLATTVADGSQTDSASTPSYVVHDVAGNTATAGPFSFKVDKTAPTFSCPGSGDTSWHNANVTLSCSGDDGTGGSGVAAADGTFSLATTVADGSQTDSASTPSYVVHDVAGNTATAGPFSFKVDRKNPTFSCPGSGDTSWHNANVTLSCSGDDGTGGSGVAAADGTFSLATTVADGSQTDSASTPSYVVHDVAGNTATAGPFSFKVDKTAPTFSCPGSGDTSWHNANVTLSCSGDDGTGGSGVAAADGTFSLATTVADGSQTDSASTPSYVVHDVAGNTATAGPFSFKVDKTAPTFSCPGSGDTSWHNANVTLSCSGDDGTGGSGVAAADGTFSLATTVADGSQTDSASTPSYVVHDVAGNTATAGPFSFKVDKTAPTFSCPGSGDTSWHNANVTLSCSGDDGTGGSGVAAADGTFSLATTVADGSQTDSASTPSYVVHDVAGNTATAGPFSFKVDKTAPTFSCPGSGDTSWHNANVTLSCSGDDGTGGSGVAAADGTFSLATTVADGSQTDSASTPSYVVHDVAGNTATAGPFSFKVDKTAPTFSCPGSGDTSWHNANVTLSCSGDDGTGGSGVAAADGTFSLATTVADGSQTDSASTPSYVVHDVAGNTATAGPFSFKVDKTAPTFSCPGSGDTSWHNANVTLSCSGDDGTGGSGVAAADGTFSLATTVADGSQTDSASTPSYVVHDVAGNTATAGPFSFKVDRKNPTFSCPGSGDTSWHNANVTLSCSGDDGTGGSGVAAADGTFSLATTVADGSQTDSASTPSYVVHDVAGNTATAGPFSFKVDKTAPTFSCPGSGDTSWHNANVTLSCSGDDGTGGSGVAAADGTFSLATTVADGSQTDSASTPSYVVHDVAGNTATAGPFSFKVDRKNPTFSCPGSGDTSWHNANVTLSCSGDDGTGGSGVAAADGTFSLATTVADGSQTDSASTPSYVVHDVAGNTATAGPFSFKVDRKNPTFSCPGSGDTSWHNANVTLSCSGDDGTGGSGVAAADGTFSLATTVADGSQTDSASTPSYVVHDVAGNTATAGPFSFKVDRKNPTFSCPGSGDTSWHNANVTLSCSGDDGTGGSGVAAADGTFSLATTVADGSQTDSASTPSYVVHDVAGNTATAGPFSFKVDRKNPTFSCPGSGDTSWHNANVTLSCSGDDGTGGSGVAAADGTFSLATTVADGSQTDSASTPSYVVHDVAGNTATAGPFSFKVDRKNPTFSCPGSGDTSWHNANVTLSCSGDDGTGGSGVAAADGTFSLATTVADGSQTDSASTPSYVVHDVAGNTATAGPFSFKVDRKNPTFSCPGSGDTSWHNANVTLSCSGDDGTGGSGVAAADGTFWLATTVADGSQTDSASTPSYVVHDVAGNTATAGPFSFKVDRKNPTFSCPGSGDTSWHNANVTLSCSGDD